MGQSIPEWTKQYLRMDLAKLLEDSRPYPFKFFKGCLPQILLGLFLNALSHVIHMEIQAKISHAVK